MILALFAGLVTFGGCYLVIVIKDSILHPDTNYVGGVGYWTEEELAEFDAGNQ